MAAEIIQGDVFEVLPTLKPGSVDVVCTSPPYWRLRSYLSKGHPLKPRELGSEESPDCGMSHKPDLMVLRDDLTEEERLLVLSELIRLGIVR